MIRLSGLASGMDTESMVNDLMKAERMRVDIKYQQRQLLEWKREDYRDMNTKLLALRNSVFDLKLQGSFSTKTVSSSDSTVLTAKAASSVLEGQYAVKVEQLASGVTIASAAALPTAIGEEDVNGNVLTLAEQFADKVPPLAEKVTFTIAGSKGEKEFSFDTAEDNIYDVIVAINSAEIGINASYDEGIGRVFLSTTDTGSEAKIEFTADADGEYFLGDALGLDLTAKTGTDAKIEFQGVSGLTFSSNQFAINGINFSLNKTGEATINVSTDIDSAVDKIKGFVEAYNNAIDLIGGKLKEERDRDYQPLNDEQKEAMKEKDVELWEKRARSGIFRADSLLNGIYSRMRGLTMDKVTGLDDSNDYTSLSAIGITTSPNWNDNGKLYIDEDKLREALNSDREGVMELFTGNENVDGLADKLHEQINESMGFIQEKAGSASAAYDQSFLSEQIRDVDEDIETWEDRLAVIEQKYWNQFTAMEKAIQQMNNQGAWLQQQLSALG